jgi:hypothetical protein
MDHCALSSQPESKKIISICYWVKWQGKHLGAKLSILASILEMISYLLGWAHSTVCTSSFIWSTLFSKLVSVPTLVSKVTMSQRSSSIRRLSRRVICPNCNVLCTRTGTREIYGCVFFKCPYFCVSFFLFCLVWLLSTYTLTCNRIACDLIWRLGVLVLLVGGYDEFPKWAWQGVFSSTSTLGYNSCCYGTMCGRSHNWCYYHRSDQCWKG